jgi:hypothetical protein
MGHDRNCGRWISTFREQPSGDAGGRRRGGRAGRIAGAEEATPSS